MAKRQTTFLLKRSNIPGKIPPSSGLTSGELALNTADGILYTSGSTSGTILPIGWDRVSRTGDTMTGSLYSPSISATTISATTYLNLPTDVRVTGGTFNDTTGVATFTNNTGGTFNVNGFSIGGGGSVFTGGTVTGPTTFTNGLSATTMSAESITLKNYIDFNTGTTTPTNVSGRVFFDNQTHSLAYFPDIDQNVKVEMGQQLYIRGYNNTGSIIPKGTVLSIQSATNGLPNFTPTVTNSQVVGLAASDIPINGNGLSLSQGILSGITINSFNIGDILYASPFSAGTYVADTNTFPFSTRTNQIGYVIATGTSTGEIYVSINNEDENLTLTDIERNILEGNIISTGTYEYTGTTVASSTTINVAPLRGWLVNNTYLNATNPYVINIYYTGGTNISLTNISSADSTYLLVNSGATLYQQTTFPTPQQRRENIYLGKVNHPNRTSILNINNTVDYDVSPMSSLRDLWSPIKYINQGIIPSPNGANLSFNTSAGTLWGNGINWHNNQLNPNSVSISGKTPASFFYRTQTGGTSSSVTVIDPTKYDVDGVLTSIIPAGSDDATNQRIYLYPTGVINVLYGQTRYTTLAAAIAAIQSETFIPYPNAESTGILIGVISVRNDIVANGQPLTNPDYAKFTLVSKFGESFGGTGGLSTTTLQQAYNNSVNPEIITNSTLDALSIKNGTGNADNTTKLLEGLNTAGNTTSFIRADGYISGTTVVADTISATTYLNLPPFSGDYLPLSGGTVYGNSYFTNGLTANTISATTINATNLYVTGGTQSLFSGSSSVEMVKIIQAGSGDAFVVEDQSNGDTSHFVINASGNTAIGLVAPLGNDKLTVSGNTTIYGTLSATSIYSFIPIFTPSEIYRGITLRNNSTTIDTYGGVTMSTTASNTAQAVASTNFATKQIRLKYSATVVSTGRYTGTRGTALLWFIGGGFRYVCDFYISDTAFGSTCQQFYGLAGQTTDLAYGDVALTQVSTLTNLIGLGNDGSDSNLQIIHNDSGGTATKIDLGVNFPANRTAGAASTTVYSLTLYNAPSSNEVKYMVVNNETGAVAMGTITTNLPANTLGLNFFASRAMGSGGGLTNSGQFDLLKLGVYSLL